MPAIKKEKDTLTMVNTVPTKKQDRDYPVTSEYEQEGPSIYLEVEVPALNNQAVGDKFTFTGKARLKSMEERKTKKGTKKSYVLELLQIGVT